MEGTEMLHELILAAVRAQRHASLMTPIIPMILKMLSRWILVGTKKYKHCLAKGYYCNISTLLSVGV